MMRTDMVILSISCLQHLEDACLVMYQTATIATITMLLFTRKNTIEMLTAMVILTVPYQSAPTVAVSWKVTYRLAQQMAKVVQVIAMIRILLNTQPRIGTWTRIKTTSRQMLPLLYSVKDHLRIMWQERNSTAFLLTVMIMIL